MENYDLERIKSVIQRAQSGQELTIGFLGGSITQGSLATEHEQEDEDDKKVLCIQGIQVVV